MSLVVLACDPSNLQIVNGVAECSQWIAVEHTRTFFEIYAAGTPQERQQLQEAGILLFFKVVVFFVLLKILWRF